MINLNKISGKKAYVAVKKAYIRACKHAGGKAFLGAAGETPRCGKGKTDEEWIQFAAGSIEAIAKRLLVLYKSGKTQWN